MTRPWAARVLVLVAGVTMNFVLAFLIFTGLFYVGTEPVAVNPLAQGPTNSFFLPSLDEAVGMGYARYDGVEISALSGSLAETAGIGQEDQVIAINGIYVYRPDEFMYAVKLGIPLDLILDKDGAKRVVQLTPQDGKIGVQVMHRNLEFNKNFHVSFGFLDAIKQ